MAPDRRAIPCAVESAQRAEPLHGTASRVRRWVLVEQSGAWGHDALTESELDPLVARVLIAHGRRYGTRVLVIRRPGWREEDGPRRVYLARSDVDVSWIEQLELSDQALLDLDFRVLEGEAPPGLGLGSSSPPSLHLVCTHGRHDQCCANFGRPVVRALDAAGTPDVWESSHVGGDRFAANIVCLPTGVYFGRVPPDGAAELLADQDRGLLSLDHYRGRSCYPPLVQAADVLARRELGERRLDAVRLASIEREGGDETATVVLTVEGTPDAVRVRVRRVRGEPRHLTCAESGTSRPWAYELVNLA